MTAPMVPTCPICQTAVSLFALWDSAQPGEPPAPAFWGRPGQRAIRCQAGPGVILWLRLTAVLPTGWHT